MRYSWFALLVFLFSLLGSCGFFGGFFSSSKERLSAYYPQLESSIGEELDIFFDESVSWHVMMESLYRNFDPALAMQDEEIFFGSDTIVLTAWITALEERSLNPLRLSVHERLLEGLDEESLTLLNDAFVQLVFIESRMKDLLIHLAQAKALWDVADPLSDLGAKGYEESYTLIAEEFSQYLTVYSFEALFDYILALLAIYSPESLENEISPQELLQERRESVNKPEETS